MVGINTAIYSPSGTAGITGIGFSIPINTARRVVNDLLRYGHVRRATLGIRYAYPLGPGLARALGLPVQSGLLIEEVQPGSPAAHAGLRGGNRTAMVGFEQVLIGGDVLTAFDGQAINDPLDLEMVLNDKRPGQRVRLTIYRGSQKLEVTVTLGQSQS